MALIHERPSGAPGTLCSVCHASQLEALDEDAAILRAEEEDDHVWCITLSVGLCACCREGSTLSRLKDRIYGDAICSRVSVWLTVNEFVNISKGVTPAAVTTRSEASANAGGHLATLKTIKIFHTVMDVALMEILPYLGAIMSRERQTMEGCFWGPCCGFTRKDGVISRVPVSIVKADGTKVDRFAIDVGDDDGDMVYNAIMDLGLGGDVKLLKDPNASFEAGALAVKFGATPFEPIFWQNDVFNAEQAIDGRIRKVKVPLTISQSDEDELHKTVAEFVERFRKSPTTKAIIYSILFIDMKSKKWTEQRARQALMDLQAKYDPEYKFKGQVKLEPTKSGKPPRLIIADGDIGQVMAWCVFALIERYLYSSKGYKHRSIKGVAKARRMHGLSSTMRRDYTDGNGNFLSRMVASILENDGSAWDACMRARLREIVEYPLIRAATDMFKDMFTPESMYVEQHAASTQGDVIVVRFPVKMREFHKKDLQRQADQVYLDVPLYTYAALQKEVRIKIDAIRRSGHRGTSVLNWWSNHILWAWVLFGDRAGKYADPLLINNKTIFGTQVGVLWLFEGDDSLLLVTGTFTDDQIAELSKRWTKLGHRPKLHYRRPGDAAEFCGWKILVDEYGLVEGTAVVDVPRQFRNGHTCIAPEAVTSVLNSDRSQFAKVAVPGMLCRAYNIAPHCPSLARYFLSLAEYFHGGRVQDADFTTRMLIKMGEEAADLPEMWRIHENDLRSLEVIAELDSVVSKVYQAVETSTIDAASEAEFAVAQGWVDSVNAYNTFVNKLFAAGFSQHNLLSKSDIPGKFAPDE